MSGPDAPDAPDAPNARFEIDRRPLLVVLASRLRRQLWLLLVFSLFACAIQFAPPTGLTEAGWRTVCIFVLCAILWGASLLPMAVTSLVAIAFLPMFGVFPARVSYAFFGSHVVFFILGAFMLAAALVASGLSTRLATHIVRRFGRTPRHLILAVFTLCAGASMVMSIHAVAAMVFPIVISVTEALKLRRGHSNLGRALFLALAWGCTIGGALTILGGGRAALGIGILEEVSGPGVSIGFTEFIAFSWPLVLLLMLVVPFILLKVFPPEIEHTDDALSLLEKRLHAMGKPTPREMVVGAVVVATIVLWTVAGDTLGIAAIAICSTAALFAFGTLSWDDIEKNVKWGIVLMYGGALSLGAAMERTGAASWVTDALLQDLDLAPWLLVWVIGIAAGTLTEFMSNSAVVAMLMPPALALAQSAGVDPRAMAMAVILPSNFAFVSPISSPVMAIAWGGGHLAPKVTLRTGVLIAVVGHIGMAGLIALWWPLLDLF